MRKEGEEKKKKGEGRVGKIGRCQSDERKEKKEGGKKEGKKKKE